jgi:predicted DNA-binding ribbon-helix-helix protein
MVEGRRTSVKLDTFTWRCLQEICLHRGMSVHEFCTEVKRAKTEFSGFTNALRIAILRHYRDIAAIVGSDDTPAQSYATARGDTVGRAFQTSPM